MTLPKAGEEILQIAVDADIWLVLVDESDDELISLKVYCEGTSVPEEANAHWDRCARSFDEVPSEVPVRVKTRIHGWMRAHAG